MMISIILWVLGLSLLGGLGYLYFVYIKPWRTINFYKKQGCEMTFVPMLGTYKILLESFTQHGDFYAYYKHAIKRNPQAKAIGGNIVGKTQISLADPNVIKDFYTKQENYVKAPLLVDLMSIFLGSGLVTAEESVWKKHRRIIGTAFHFGFQRDMVPGLVELADQFLEKLKQEDLEKVDMIHAFEAITGEVVGRLFFGEKFSEYQVRGKPITTFLSQLAMQVGSQLQTLPYVLFGSRGIKWKLTPAHKNIMEEVGELNNFAKGVIQRKREEMRINKENNIVKEKSARTLIELLLEINEKNPQETFTDQEIIDEFATFFIGGMETTGHTVALALYYLSANPQFKEKLMAEVDKYFKDPSQVVLDTLNQMEFMTAFMKETLRMGTPTPIVIDRLAVRDHELAGLKVKKGTLVNICFLSSNYNPIYHDNEEVFDPERWIKDTKTKQSTTQNPYVFIPFSSGSHNCIGQHVAMNEARIIFSLFLKKFDYILTPGYKHTMMQRFVYEPGERLTFKLIPKAK